MRHIVILMVLIFILPLTTQVHAVTANEEAALIEQAEATQSISSNDETKRVIYFEYIGLAILALVVFIYAYQTWYKKDETKLILPMLVLAAIFLIFFSHNPKVAKFVIKIGDIEMSVDNLKSKEDFQAQTMNTFSDRIAKLERENNNLKDTLTDLESSNLASFEQTFKGVKKQVEQNTTNLFLLKEGENDKVVVQKVKESDNKGDSSRTDESKADESVAVTKNTSIKELILNSVIAERLQNRNGDQVTFKLLNLDTDKILCNSKPLIFNKTNQTITGQSLALTSSNKTNPTKCLIDKKQINSAYLKAEIIYKNQTIYFGFDYWLNENPDNSQPIRHTFEYDGYFTHKKYVVDFEVKDYQPN